MRHFRVGPWTTESSTSGWGSTFPVASAGVCCWSIPGPWSQLDRLAGKLGTVGVPVRRHRRAVDPQHQDRTASAAEWQPRIGAAAVWLGQRCGDSTHAQRCPVTRGRSEAGPR